MLFFTGLACARSHLSSLYSHWLQRFHWFYCTREYYSLRLTFLCNSFGTSRAVASTWSHKKNQTDRFICLLCHSLRISSGKRKQEEKQKKIPAEEADQSLPTNKTAEDPESFTTAPMNELKRQRRNSICAMLMPAEYFAALPHLELLNVRYEFGLEEEPASDSGSKDEG